LRNSQTRHEILDSNSFLHYILIRWQSAFDEQAFEDVIEMKFNIKTMICSVAIAALSTAGRAQITVAIGDFENQTDRFFLDSWEQRIPEFLSTELSLAEGITVVERQRLRAILDEQAISQTGLVDSSKAQAVGKILSAQYLIAGMINQNGDWLRIDAKVINTSTAKIIGEKVQCRDEIRLDKMVALLGNNLRYQLTGTGEYRKAVSIRTYPTRFLLLATLGGALATAWVHHSYLNKRDAYRGAVGLNDFDSIYDSANRLYKTRTALSFITGAGFLGTAFCWLRNRNPDQIMARDPSVSPYFAENEKGEMGFGVRLRL
jgi:TolB-like protein